jgi:hypothetical protein
MPEDTGTQYNSRQEEEALYIVIPTINGNSMASE